MNGNLNTALLLTDTIINNANGSDYIEEPAEKLKKVLLEEVEKQKQTDERENHAEVLLQEMRDDGILFGEFENRVTRFFTP